MQIDHQPPVQEQQQAQEPELALLAGVTPQLHRLLSEALSATAPGAVVPKAVAAALAEVEAAKAAKAEAGAKGKGKGKGKGKAGTVAAVATVDQFIRHAESGFFGDDEEADCPFVWDGDC